MKDNFNVNKRERKKLFSNTNDESITAYLFLFPAVISWIIWFLVPFFRSLYISFFKYSYVTPSKNKFVGLGNYIQLFQDQRFYVALKNTILFVVIVVPMITILSLLLAFILNHKFKSRGTFRTIYYLPYVIAPITVATVFMYLFVKDGVMAKFLSLFGFQNVTWYSNIKLAMPFIGTMFVWQMVGFYMVYYLSGFQTIPHSLYESAQIDGANGAQKFRYITVPLLRPTTFLVVTYSTIQAFQLFDQIAAVSSASGGLGSPAGATSTLLTYFYQNSFRYYRMGYGSAIAVVLFLLIIIVTCIQKKFTDSDGVY